MLKARKNKLFESLFSIYNTRILKKFFYRIHIKGEENFILREPGIPTVIYANHSNWWDGLIAFYLSKTLWNIDAYVMMDIEQMSKYKFFRRIGAFSVKRDNPKEAVESVNYAVNLLKNTERVLWIFPQGIMQPNDYRPIMFFNGVSKIAGDIGNVNLIPLVFRYEFLMEQRPEVFISIGKAKKISPGTNLKELTQLLNNELLNELNSLKAKVTGVELENFNLILQGKSSRNKTLDNIYGKN